MTMSTDFKPTAVKPTVTLADLDKLDVRVGTIELVENVQRSDKLVRLRVNFGDHKRTILVGMKKERPDPKAEIEGKQALFVVNLPARTMAGEKSEGMMFDIGFSDGILRGRARDSYRCCAAPVALQHALND
jgi:tRNA-binding protein